MEENELRGIRLRRGRWVSAALTAAVMMAASSAWGEPVTSYPLTHGQRLRAMRIEAPRANIPLCVVLPRSAGDCGELDAEAVRTRLRSAVSSDQEYLGFATLVYEDHAVSVAVTYYRHRMKDMSTERLTEFMRGMSAAADESGVSELVRPPRRSKVRDWEAIEFAANTPLAEGVQRARSASLLAEDGMLQITVSAPLAREAELNAVFDHVLETVEFDAGDLGKFGKPHSYILGYRMAPLIFILLVPLAALLAVGAALLWWLKSKRAASGS